MKSGRKISTDGGADLGQNPFEALSGERFASRPDRKGAVSPSTPATRPASSGRRRVDIRREKSGRGGKTVTVVSGLQYLGREKTEALAKRLRREIGVGGAVKDQRIELQGDHRERLVAFFEAEGFRPVVSGG